jgi:cobalt-zinc-cadmium efflux system membrane fusion protein
MKMLYSELVEKTAFLTPKLNDGCVSDIVVSRRNIARLIAAVAVSATLLAAVGCNGSVQGSRGMTSYSGNSAEPSDKAQLFTIPADQMAHVQIVTVEPTSIVRTLRLTGAVSFNGFDTTPVITQVSGPVSRIVVTPGQQVHRGEPLLYVASPDYSQLLANYLKARDAYALAEKGYLRAKDLYDHSAIAQRDLEVAESARAQAAADLDAANQSLRILGISKPEEVGTRQTGSELPVLAPIAGQAVERLVAPGQVIQAGATQVFTISNMSSVWVLANLYQKDLPNVRLGDPVTITTDSYPNTAFHGKISYIAAALDPDTRTLQARIEVNNPHGELKKDMYVVCTVQSGTIRDALTVPDSAVLRDAQNQPFVYVVTQNNEFSRRAVALGQRSDNTTQLTGGISPGDRVVGDGSLFLQFANSLQQ